MATLSILARELSIEIVFDKSKRVCIIATMNVIVIYPGDATFVLHFSDVPLNSAHPAVLERVFRETNHVDGTEWIANKKLRSMMIGDVVIIDDKYYLCEMVGWRELKDVFEAIDVQRDIAGRNDEYNRATRQQRHFK